MAINRLNKCSVSMLFHENDETIFRIPKYQREYTWGTLQWEDLFDDLSDNSVEYFLGTIICVDIREGTNNAPKLEVIDGQQRLTTISLMLLALHSVISSHKETLTDDQLLDLRQLKRKLVVKDTKSCIRIVPQEQNNNLGDYRGILAEEGITTPYTMPKFAGLRRIKKAFEYFYKRIEGLLVEHATGDLAIKTTPLFVMLEKINSAIVVMIEVSSHSDAYTLFESLNNRGTPLTPVDLIKNILLAKLEEEGEENIDYYFSQWQQILNYIGDDYSVQERFFRHYYNAFRRKINATHKTQDTRGQYLLGSLATRSNLLSIYEKIIKKDPLSFLEAITENSSIYSRIILKNDENVDGVLNNSYKTLSRVRAAPSYLLLMYLESEKDKLGITEADIIKIIDMLVKFFIRRNLTDEPPTRDLTRIFMDIVDDIEDEKLSLGLSANAIYKVIKDKLMTVSASDSAFEEKLSGQIYNDNRDATRFILCALAERDMTIETKVNLWQRSGALHIWTIEHIFPQGDTIPIKWVEMIAGGDNALAKDYQNEYVHTLGNLTITGFNSQLSNRPFKDKRDRKDKDGKNNGYRNGLNLNTDVVNQEVWTVDAIKARTARLVREAIELFAW